jgi:DNA-binding transcriptional ArsR family regulator
MSNGRERPILLAEVETLLASRALIVDACRRLVHHRGGIVGLARRPVLFLLAQALAGAWPAEVTREDLIVRVFDVRRANESHRARLRVEVGRLRRELRPFAGIAATRRGFLLTPHRTARVMVLAPPIDGAHAALLALLADGGPWATSALALALGSSQRSVQRALSSLEEAGKVRSLGRARARRWLGRPLAGFTPLLLLPVPPAIG